MKDDKMPDFAVPTRKNIELPDPPFKQEDHNPEEGNRICTVCDPPVQMVWDLRKPYHEYRCPKCNRYEEFFGTTHKP